MGLCHQPDFSLLEFFCFILLSVVLSVLYVKYICGSKVKSESKVYSEEFSFCPCLFTPPTGGHLTCLWPVSGYRFMDMFIDTLCVCVCVHVCSCVK